MPNSLGMSSLWAGDVTPPPYQALIVRQEFEVYSYRPAACIVTFVAGTSVANIDSGLKQTIMMIAADMYDQRINIVHGSSSQAVVDYKLLLNAWRKSYFA